MKFSATIYQPLGKILTVGMLALLLAYPMAAMADPEGEPPVQKTTTVKASVLPYASVIADYPNVQPVDLGTFSGIPNQPKPTRLSGFFVETNVALDLNYGFSLLTNGGATLDTKIAVQNNSTGQYLTANGFSDELEPVYHDGSITAINGQAKQTIEEYSILYKVQTGPSISSQPAGTYNGTVSLTVSAHGI